MGGRAGLGQVVLMPGATMAFCNTQESQETVFTYSVTPGSSEHRGHVVLEGFACSSVRTDGATTLDHTMH
jgi:hypothetical protein